MTEAEWLAAAEPTPMLQFLGDRASDRKRRLFACACCRRHWHWVEGTPAAKTVEVAEKFADGRATEKKLAAADRAAEALAGRFYSEFQSLPGAVNPYIAHMHASACAEAASIGETRRERSFADSAAIYAAQTYAHEVTGATDTSRGWDDHFRAEVAAQAAVLREIVGNPFRVAHFDPAWRTADVSLLAEGIYGERAFDRAPILADALQDAGCDAADLLAHLRDPSLLPWERPGVESGPPPVCHARGCWALDVVLGRS